MKYISLLSLTFLFSCELLDNRGKKAIEICQQSKVQLNNGNIFSLTLTDGNSTWIDYANMIARMNPNSSYKWDAYETFEPEVFMVQFIDIKGWGHRWEVKLDDKIVKHINSNDYLSRKYGFTRIGKSESFLVKNISKDTLRVYKPYRNSTPTVIYEITAEVLNNSQKQIISADIDGVFKLIFREKTVEGESRYSDGFVSRITKNRPWKPGETKQFKLRTKGIDIIYADYLPEYVIFELSLNAEDPVGYEFDENLQELDLRRQWENLK